MKLRHRGLHLYSERRHNTGWHAFLARQKRKLANKIDYVNAWQRREFFSLEKMNAGEFRQEWRLKHGSAWNFTANLQITKLGRLHAEQRRKPAFRTSWKQSIFAFSSRKYSESPGSEWKPALLGAVTRAANLRAADNWRSVIWNAYRRRSVRALDVNAGRSLHRR